MITTPTWDREAQVEARFCAWLAEQGWTDIVRASGRNYLDVGAVKDGRKLYAEVKGRTKDPGIDADIAYGQLLRRMDDPEGSYALVAPVGPSLERVLRVPHWVRQRLGIDVYSVNEAGHVRLVSPGARP